MLILSRKINESIVIDGHIVVKVLRIDGDQVKLGIQAPTQVPVHRHEVYAEIQKNNEEALARGKARVPRLRPAVGVPVVEEPAVTSNPVPTSVAPTNP
jgi:carbon storage regulator